ncbi:Bug family tripartite tricarboxylate transporter substrate binding protein [Bordetella hinzii]|uniref:Tripartite tricarboxylate transporter substrate binding protein n=2 Tax=Bordetella hinzii TaxID=103855 RepID=A0AAN1VH68_9BORD|nr:tripartite tricarboxylate transporter substrate binding protein [Bordetella hinzii]AKQ60189.1 Tripartite tricarboxylate transporter family receptor [Bordetella hinzii]AZW18734.1 tripartite tricarboxylate transporter substrate binding protein [Bordetella hinzii]KCB24571.1 tripartite tricarboxylate transporter family receptor [Bordetella hinzii OH87 BAL007II]KCB34449.1 tripartite tricarboxylate transporter family receptor [Bordetella hinzii CA90 BAL1384]KCB39383.1 tripartite tricarboxylate tr
MQSRLNFRRRSLLKAGAAFIGLPGLALAEAVEWPRRPVRFIVPFAPGGGADIATRMTAERLQALWGGVPAIVENKAGANTVIAASSVLNSARDGSTFLATIGLTMQLPALMDEVPFDPMQDLLPVGALTLEQLVLVTHPQSGFKTFTEMKQAARGKKGLAFGSYGVGSQSHLLLTEINQTAGVDILHVPYKGAAPAVQAVMAGEVSLALTNLGTVKEHVASGRLLALAVTGSKRYRFVPQVPTLKECGIEGFDTPSWIGVFAPKGVPEPIIARASQTLRSALRAPELLARLEGFCQEPGDMSRAEFAALVAKGTEDALRMIRASGVKLS